MNRVHDLHARARQALAPDAGSTTPMSNQSIDALYAKVQKALATVDQSEAKADAARWEAAETMAELYQRGEKQTQIAAKLNCSQRTVARHLEVWRLFAPGGLNRKRPPFAEALSQVRDYRQETIDRKNIPKEPEKQAALVADLLKDKAVADNPAVREAQARNTDRRLREKAQTFNRDHGILSNTDKQRTDRQFSKLAANNFWFDLEVDINSCIRRLGEARTEVERTGVPAVAGESIRRARALVKAAQRFEEAITKAGIGAPPSK